MMEEMRRKNENRRDKLETLKNVDVVKVVNDEVEVDPHMSFYPDLGNSSPKIALLKIYFCEASFSHITLPIFDGENYDLWEVKMQSYMESLDLWDAVEEDYEIYPLPENPTMAQIKNHKERKMKKAKARSCLFTGVSQMIFIRIMTLKSPKAIWDYLKEEYAGDDRI
ncbi:hypothetical protein D0Y65_048527 [Glycine soja]|uniref:Uncharacterized protein n=1 Tax=Glycine soja TaxID=3848 RepID=A0A445FT91_GLYSO|nr:hypothetical protein D0Y65_048527 [Glycine soja]